MSILRMILREIQRGKLNYLLCLLTVTCAVSIFVALLTMSKAAARSTAMLLRDMGFNVLITPEGTQMERYWALDFEDVEMPEGYVRKLAKSNVPADHFVGKLQKTITLGGRTVILTGLLPEMQRRRTGKTKTVMSTSYYVSGGSVVLGSEVAKITGVSLDDDVELLGRRFSVKGIIEEKGSLDDIRLYAHLHDVQDLLGKPGKINAIDALGCVCSAKSDDLLAEIETEIREVLPETQVKHYRSIAIARDQTRRMFDRYAFYSFVIVLVLGAWAVAGFTLSNVRQRRREIGLLRAVGVRTGMIAVLFLGKIALYSVIGTVLGFVLGTLVASTLGPALVMTQTHIAWNLLWASLPVTPFLSFAFGLLPIAYGLNLDPSLVLSEE